METALRPLTRGHHHFFGYYDRCPWSLDGRWILACRAKFMDRRPHENDVLRIGLLDMTNADSASTWREIAQTCAWNWQQGAQVRWLSEREIVFNDRFENSNGKYFGAAVVDIQTGARRELPAPVYALAPGGKSAITLDFSRAFDIRAGYGYAGIHDARRDDNCPRDGGIWSVNLGGDAPSLLVSMAQVAAASGESGPIESGPSDKHWLDHLTWNTDGSRFCFLHRWGTPREGGGAWWKTRLFTSSADGSGLRCVSDHRMVSHFDWRDESHILAWANRQGRDDAYFLFRDAENSESEIVGEGVLTADGHCTYSPDRRWILTDTYPDKTGHKTLLLWDVENQKRIDLARIFGPMPSDVDIRCDLHPRWSRDGKQICIDSIHEGTRQMYVMDVAEVVG
jgi:hypothetical protein